MRKVKDEEPKKGNRGRGKIMSDLFAICRKMCHNVYDV